MSEFDKLANKLDEVFNKMDKRIDRLETILLENRDLYTNFIKKNQEITEKVVAILEENRRIYLEAFTEVENKEDENLKALKPILEDMSRQNEIITQKMASPFLTDRIHYRKWRSLAYHKGEPNLSKKGVSSILESPIFEKYMDNEKDNEINENKITKRRV